MCDDPDCTSDPCIYDDEVQEGIQAVLVAQQVADGYFD